MGLSNHLILKIAFGPTVSEVLLKGHFMVNGTAKKSPSQIFFKFGMWILHLFNNDICITKIGLELFEIRKFENCPFL